MESPSGRPDVLFFLPEVLDTRNHMVDVDLDELELRIDAAIDLCKVVTRMNLHSWQKSLQFPHTPEEACPLFSDLENFFPHKTINYLQSVFTSYTLGS